MDSAIKYGIYLGIIVNLHRRSNPVCIQTTNMTTEPRGRNTRWNMDSSNPKPDQVTDTKRKQYVKPYYFEQNRLFIDI